MRRVLVCVAVASFAPIASGCVASRYERSPDQVELERRQWGAVQQEAPLVGEALLLSLLALEESDPISAAQARQQAIELSRRAGVVTTPRLTCNACTLPKNDGEVPNHLVCLRERVNCLHPR